MVKTTKAKKACCEQSKEKTRYEMIEAILNKCYYFSQAERLDSIDVYSRSKLSLEEILLVTSGLREMQENITKHKKQFHKDRRQISRMGVY